MSTTKPAPPAKDAARWSYTAQRRRILYDEHKADVLELARTLLGSERADTVLKEVDTSANLAENVCNKLAVLYSETPTLSHPTATDLELDQVQGLVERSEFWLLQDRTQRDTLGLRECFVHLSVDDSGEVEPRLVFPDCVSADEGKRVDRPRVIREARDRDTPEGPRWFWDVTEFTEQGATYRILTSLDGGEDVTSAYSPGGRTDEGTVDVYRYGDGTPFLPYTLYRAAKLSSLWSPKEWGGLFAGSLHAAAARSFWGHCFRQASWSQRWAANAEVLGSVSGRATVDPAIVTQLRALIPEHPIQAGQWSPPVSPLELFDNILQYEHSVISGIGIDPAAVLRSSDPRSGIALRTALDAQRDTQKQWTRLFASRDGETIGKMVAMHNRVTGGTLPERGWRVHHNALPPTASELQAKQSQILELVDRGLKSKSQAYVELNPGVDIMGAQLQLSRIAEEQKMIDAGVFRGK